MENDFWVDYNKFVKTICCHIKGEGIVSTKKLDENGKYRLVDPVTGEFIEEDYPVIGNIGQMEHQTVTTVRGNVIDPDEIYSDVIDEDGNAVISADELAITNYIKEAVSIDNLVDTFKENSHETLLKLLALQDNKHPLKKGGVGIAYRTDALIMHCKMEFTAQENIVFDAILGTMSSFPENKTYRIEPTSFLKLSKYENERYLYEIFQKGTKKLVERHLHFDNLGPDGDDELVIPWFEILRYHKQSKKNEIAYIEFQPTDFFKDLALCSKIVHGAYGSIEVTTQLRGKYTHAIFWFLENKKRYRAYPNATQGVFEISVEELKNQFSIPESYVRSDIERRVLKPAKDSINSTEECDFTFEYDAINQGSKLVGYIFYVKEKDYIDVKHSDVVEAIEAKVIDPFESQIRDFFDLTGYKFNDEEIHQFYLTATKYNRDAAFIMQAAVVFKTRISNKSKERIDDPFAYMYTLIKNGKFADINSLEKEYKKNKNKFNNFSQHEYDWDELEKKLFKY